MRKIMLFLIAGAVIATAFGWLGGAGAVPAPQATRNNIMSADLKTEADISVMTLTLESPAKYRIEPLTAKSMYLVVFPGSSHSPALEYKAFGDIRIKRADFYQRNVKDAVVEIVLKDMKTSIFHSLSPDGRTLTVRFKGRKELLSLTVDPTSPGEKEAKAKRDDELTRKSLNLYNNSGKVEFKEALEDYRKQDYKSAIPKLEAFIERFPQSVYLEKAYFLRAEAFYMITAKQKKFIGRAIDAYQDVTSKYPDSEGNARARVRLADLYSAQEMDVEALAIYENVMKAYPGSKYALHGMLGRARIYLGRKLYYEAYNELEKILLLYPESKEVKDARFQIAQAYYLRAKYEDALKVFESSNKKWPSYVKTDRLALYRFADSNYRLKNYPRAKELFIELMNIFPETPEGKEAVNRLADIYLDAGDVRASVKLLGIQARRIPDEPSGLESRLRLAALGQYPDKVITPAEATVMPYNDYFNPLATYNDIIKKHPTEIQSREALYQKAKLYNRQSRHIESIVSLKALIKKFPEVGTSKQVLDLIGVNLYALVRGFHGQDGYFAVLYTYYDHFDPFFKDLKDPEILMAVGDAYYEMGIFERSLEKFVEADRLADSAPFKDRIAYGEGRAHAALQKNDDAVANLNRFMGPLGKSPYAADALHVLGGVYEEKKDYPAAIAAYERAITLEKDGPMATYSAYRAGLLYKNGGLYRKAIQSFQAAIDKFKMEPPFDDYYLMDSHFQLMEAAYRSGMYPDAVKYSEEAQRMYPEAVQVRWARFVKSDSEARLSNDEKAVATLKALAKEDATSVYGHVAMASVGLVEWKEKNRNLFPY